MSYIRVCDLCGKPLPLDDGGRKFKIKEHWTGFLGSSWITVEVHDECLRRLFDALDDKREEEEGKK